MRFSSRKVAVILPTDVTKVTRFKKQRTQICTKQLPVELMDSMYVYVMLSFCSTEIISMTTIYRNSRLFRREQRSFNRLSVLLLRLLVLFDSFQMALRKRNTRLADAAVAVIVKMIQRILQHSCLVVAVQIGSKVLKGVEVARDTLDKLLETRIRFGTRPVHY